MLDPGTIDPGYTGHRVMSENGDGLVSELRNRMGAMKIHEGASPVQVTAGGITKWVMSYAVGDYALRRYKIGFGYADDLVPSGNAEYTKATKADTQNVWASGVSADEVLYVTQTEKPSWPNYHAAIFSKPGSGDIIEYNGSYYMIFHANSPMLTNDMDGNWLYDPGRLTWIAPLEFDFTGSMDTWATATLPSGTQSPSIWPSKTTYAQNEDIVIHFNNAGQGAWDWIRLYNNGAANTVSFDYKYVQGLSSTFLDDWAGDVWTWETTTYGFSGAMTFNGIRTPGNYEACFFFAGGTNPVAASCDFTITGNSITPTVYDVSSENPYGLDRDADHTVDGSGLAGDTHSSYGEATMWTSQGSYGSDYDPYITYDLGGRYDVTTMRIWNFNYAGVTAMDVATMEVFAGETIASMTSRG
jgi:hypothetical protein